MLCSSVEVIFIEQRILRHLAKYPRRNRVLKMSLSVKQRAMIYYSFNRTRGFFFYIKFKTPSQVVGQFKGFCAKKKGDDVVR